MAAGPLLGGALVSLADWRAVFAINVAIGVPAVLLSLRWMPRLPRHERRLDVGGMGTATLAIGGLVYALIEAPARGWTEPTTLLAIGVAAAAAVAFVMTERSAHAPLLPVSVYADRSFVVAAAHGALFNFAFYGLLFAMGLMLQQGRGLGAMTSGLLFVPLTGLIAVGTLCSAPLAERVGRRAVLAIGQATLALTLIAVAWASTAPALWPLALALVPGGFSSGLMVPAMTSQAMAAVAPALHGAASGGFNTARQIGAAIGIATFGPLLGTTTDLGSGFVACVLVGAAATAVALLLTVVMPPVTAPGARRSPVGVRASRRVLARRVHEVQRGRRTGAAAEGCHQ